MVTYRVGHGGDTSTYRVKARSAKEAVDVFRADEAHPEDHLVAEVWLDVTGSVGRSSVAGAYRKLTAHEAASIWFHEGDGDVRLDAQPPVDESRRDLAVMRALLGVALANVSAAIVELSRRDLPNTYDPRVAPFPVVTPQY